MCAVRDIICVSTKINCVTASATEQNASRSSRSVNWQLPIKYIFLDDDYQVAQGLSDITSVAPC